MLYGVGLSEYDEYCMSLASIKVWHKCFRKRMLSLADDANSGIPNRITDGIFQLVDGFVTQDCRVKLKALGRRSRIERRKYSYHHDGKTKLPQNGFTRSARALAADQGPIFKDKLFSFVDTKQA
ncbi:hypothetical protein HNY73_011824 [Argiope bruennichi]|uniref:Uncharacterized protein n=1 Tax=Argiope bruennichi TaxID=94029 RepID=A0A8T0ETL9_ARGBR|nr:hypothetical protein HNY73_011824 [Argiope bruennichi]